jgi:hypothetical protein
MTHQPDGPDEDVDDYVGLEREAAEQRARARGWFVRTLEPDAVITLEYRWGRINFVVAGGVVSRAWKG